MSITPQSVLAIIGLAVSLLPAATAMSGVTLLGGDNGTTLYDNAKKSLNTWSCGGYSNYLTESGTLLVPSGSASASAMGFSTIKEFGWSDSKCATALRSWTWSGGALHHAFAVMPNGHWLALGNVKATYNGGTSFWNERILEVDPATGSIVWEWNAAEHMSATKNAHKIYMPSGYSSDPLHFNSVSYDPDRNLVMVSAHNMNEVLVIERTETTALGAGSTGGRYGHGGDILFRWGNPANYNSASTTSDQVFNVVHGGNFVPSGYTGAGNLLAFANTSKLTNHSTAYEVQPGTLSDTGFVMANGIYSSTVVFSWYNSASAYESKGNWGMVQRLPNGNTFITFPKTTGNAAEVASNGQVVDTDKSTVLLEYSTNASRGLRYPLDYPGISNLSIYTGTATSSSSSLSSSSSATAGSSASSSSSGTTASSSSATSALIAPPSGAPRFTLGHFMNVLNIGNLPSGARIQIFDMQGQLRSTGVAQSGSAWFSTQGWAHGIYLVQISGTGPTHTRRIGIYH